MRCRALCLWTSTVALLVATMPSGSAGAARQLPTVASPCGASHAVPMYRHVVWILLENQGESVVGSPRAPYLNQLGRVCGLATHYVAITHPSLPNYIALTSGTTGGIADDNESSFHRLSSPSIFSELHGNWRSYEQSMPSRCDKVTSGRYAARHNPAVYYVTLRATCVHDDVPLSGRPRFNEKFTFVTPNICDDMHSCPIATGDAWLSRFVPTILRSSQYQSGSLVLFITFDENDGDAANHVPTYVVAPSVPRGIRVGATLNHYSLLRTSEQLLGLAPLGAAKRARSMLAPFHL